MCTFYCFLCLHTLNVTPHQAPLKHIIKITKNDNPQKHEFILLINLCHFSPSFPSFETYGSSQAFQVLWLMSLCTWNIGRQNNVKTRRQSVKRHKMWSQIYETTNFGGFFNFTYSYFPSLCVHLRFITCILGKNPLFWWFPR